MKKCLQLRNKDGEEALDEAVEASWESNDDAVVYLLMSPTCLLRWPIV